MTMQKVLFTLAISGALLAPCAFAEEAKTAPDIKSSAEGKAMPDAKDACKLGRAQSASGDVLKAIKSLGKCVEREPRNREAWKLLAAANLEAGRFSQSADAFANAQALKPGDEAFLNAYVSALEGAGKNEERIPVLRELAGKKTGARLATEKLLAAVEALGPKGAEKYPDEYLFALQSLTDVPNPDRYLQEKLAAAYLKGGRPGKAEAEYRGLLVKNPESAENWAGLGASLAASDPQAATECYGKAAFYSDNASQRLAYRAEQERLGKGPASSQGNQKIAVDDSKEPEGLSALATAPAASPKPSVAAANSKPAAAAADSKPAVVAANSAPTAKPKAFDLKAYQDSIYKVELNKRLAALQKPKPAPAVATTALATPTVASPPTVSKSPVVALSPAKPDSDKERETRTEEAKAKAEKEKQDLAAKADKEKQELLVKAEKTRQDSLSREDEKRAKAEKEKQELAAKVEKEKQEMMAKAEKARQDSLSRENEKRARADKEKQDLASKAEKEKQEMMAKAEKARQDSLSRENEKRAKADKEKQELAAKAEKEKQVLMAKAEKARQDSLSRENEKRAKADKEKQDLAAKAEKAKQEMMAKETEKALRLRQEQERRELAARERQKRSDRAIAFYHNGRIDSAAMEFKAVLADSPSADAYYFAGRTFLAKGAFSKALDAFKLASKDKEDLEGLKGKALMGLGKNPEALAALETQYAKSRTDSLLPDLIVLKRKAGDEAGAIVYLEILAEKRPGEG
ncbi:MAG: tetratricopeptide repeat protein, partial [Fibrobacteria bacterium]